MPVIDKDMSYLYVVGGCGVAQSKIGVTGNPNQRLGGLRSGANYWVEIEYVVFLPIRVAALAEACAHMLLDDFSMGNEWFSVESEEAILAVNKAVLMVNAGAFGADKKWNPRSIACRIPPEKIRYYSYRKTDVIRTMDQVLLIADTINQRST